MVVSGKFWNKEPVTVASPFEQLEDDDDQEDNTPLSCSCSRLNLWITIKGRGS